ncbi:restriction endonuclease subunit S [Bacillus thermotolerans]|uniref:restriction endonuclease subunit S n=1 Tax=Bacillus thermotolerans TaxID=1221996 RepID=UPI00059214F9|nr:restriction endonuclease subunit S [Bacillus thermotolerans]KKB42085.1 Type I restriction-modification system, specificity subunit S [Bacillus thermotolerans]
MKIPSIRFSSFNGDWQTSSLSNFAQKITTKNKNFEVKNVVSNSAVHGLISQRDFFDKDIANSANIDGYYVIKKGDFVYNPRISKESPYGPVNLYKFDEKGVVSPLYLCFQVDGINRDFLSYYFKSNNWHRHIYRNGDQGARHDRVSIKDREFFKMPISYPTQEEQKKISNFFFLLDQRISHQRKKVETLREQKKGLLQKIFSQELRFKDEDGKEFPKWIRKKLSELGFFKKSYSYSRSVEGKGNYRHLHYGDIHSKYDGILNNISFPTINVDGPHETIENGDLIFADASEDYKDLGKCVVIEDTGDQRIISGLHTHRFSAHDSVDPRFIMYFTKTKAYKSFIKRVGNGISVLGISKKSLEDLELDLPSLNEQRKIVDVLSTLDLKIAKEEEKHEALQVQKKGFMQQLFV